MICVVSLVMLKKRFIHKIYLKETKKREVIIKNA
jgi:hypothetical protein